MLKQDNSCNDQAEKRKRATGPKQNKIDVVYHWYKQQLSVSISIRGVELQAAAERLAQRLGGTDFKVSTCWLFRFCNRHGTANRKICGENLSADDVSIEPFQEKFRKITVIFSSVQYRWDRLLLEGCPRKYSSQQKGEFNTCRKLNKERLTALVCAIAEGCYHLEPVIYMTNKKAWATQKLFASWFHNHFVPEVEKHQLYELKHESLAATGQCSCSPLNWFGEKEGLKISVVFPPNASSLIQPIDQEAILTCNW